jgi:Spy/CpxP family protein refolding chaperone
VEKVEDMAFLRPSGLITFTAALLFYFNAVSAQDNHKNSSLRTPASRRGSPTESELTRSRTDVLQKIKETRAGTEKLLALHEAERQQLLEEYHRRRELYNQGLIARNEVLQAERALAEAMIRVEEDKRWLTETDMVITEFAMRDELLRLPGLAIGGYSETSTLLRFNGGTLWSLADAHKIEKFFGQTFGRALPISALGQTATHDRLRFDHRDAMDVALHPDSKEGQSLLSFLRQSGIPFIAFRNAVPGAATGAHIHIGKPSSRS